MDRVNSTNTVKNGNRVIIEGGFNVAYRSLPYRIVREARKTISRDCSWARSTFDKKLRGQTLFSNLEIKYLEEFFEQYNLDAWTGESINQN